MADPGEVRVSMRRTGGLAGIPLEVSVSSDELPPDDAARLREAVERADVPALVKRSPVRGPGMDMYQYELTIEREGKRDRLTISGTYVPPELAPVVELLERRAKERRRRP